MEHKHTAGEWLVNGGDDVWIGNRICVHIGDEDDARLIAAAPELLEAARAAEVIFTRQKFTPNGFDPEGIALGKLRAAIALATGSQP